MHDLIHAFVVGSAGATRHLSREQKGQFVALAWIAQIYRHIPEPKPSYVAPWDHLPPWQRETDADIFEAIERSVSDRPRQPEGVREGFDV